MRLITIPIIILLIFIILALFTPVPLLQAGESVLPADMRENTAELRQNIAQFLVDIFSMLGRYDTCIDLYDYLITQNPEQGEYYGHKAWYLHKIGKFEETILVLDGAIARDPNNPDYLLRKARITRALNKLPESNAMYHRIDQLSPQTAVEYTLTGDASLDRSMYLQAFDQYTQALSINPKDPINWEKRGDVIFALLTIPTAGIMADELFRNRNLYSEGIKSYENAIHLNPGRTQEIQMKIRKRSDIYIPKSIEELKSRYNQYWYQG